MRAEPDFPIAGIFVQICPGEIEDAAKGREEAGDAVRFLEKRPVIVLDRLMIACNELPQQVFATCELLIDGTDRHFRALGDLVHLQVADAALHQ